MGRFILLALAVFGLIWLLRRALGERSDAHQAPAPPRNTHGELVRCAYCGLHLPRAEARESGGKQYCSEEHMRLGARDDR